MIFTKPPAKSSANGTVSPYLPVRKKGCNSSWKTRPHKNEGYDVLCVDNFYTGTKQNIVHLLQNPYFELLRHDITFPLYVEVDEIYNLACPTYGSRMHKLHLLPTSPINPINFSLELSAFSFNWGDARILGSGDFVERVLSELNQVGKNKTDRKISLFDLIDRISVFLSIEKEELLSGSRKQRIRHARDLISFLAVKNMGYKYSDIANFLNVHPVSAARCAERGKNLIDKYNGIWDFVR